MKLYLTVASERAKKGQGGNNYLESEIFITDKENPKYHLRVNNSTIELLDSEERVLFIESHKGEKKKGEFFNSNARCKHCNEKKINYSILKGSYTYVCQNCGSITKSDITV